MKIYIENINLINYKGKCFYADSIMSTVGLILYPLKTYFFLGFNCIDFLIKPNFLMIVYMDFLDML